MVKPEQSLNDLAAFCAKTEDLPDLWHYCLEFYHAHGISMVSYHTDDGARVGVAEQGVIADGFPEDWVCHYLGENLMKVDPIPDLSQRLARPFRWSETPHLGTLTPAHRAYLETLSDADFGDGLAMQVFGPNMRNAYVGMGFGRGGPAVAPDQVFTLQCAAQISHLRYCELTARRLADTFDLSPREKEVLGWIAKGKSTSVIADILGVSRHTVDTLTRRIFDKLDVNDRTSASILGLGSGLIGTAFDQDKV